MSNSEKKKNKKGLTREEAIKKGGKYALATAASLFVVLSPLKSQNESPPMPGWE